MAGGSQAEDSELLTRGIWLGRPVKTPGVQDRVQRCRPGTLTRRAWPNREEIVRPKCVAAV